jgi:hypothetical protein
MPASGKMFIIEMIITSNALAGEGDNGCVVIVMAVV